MTAEPALTQHKVTVLLVDDQPMIGEAVRRMLAGEDDIVFHFCKDAAKAVERGRRDRPDRDPPGPGDARHRRPDPGQALPRERATTRETPMIVLSTKEEPKPPRPTRSPSAPTTTSSSSPTRSSSSARIRYHSKGYINLLQRNEAYQALQASQKLLANDVAQAAKYVRSLLPEKRKQGRRSGPTGGSSPRPTSGATRSATTGSTTSISPSTCSTSAATASAPPCSRSRR